MGVPSRAWPSTKSHGDGHCQSERDATTKPGEESHRLFPLVLVLRKIRRIYLYQSQKKKHTKGPSRQETSESNVNDNKGKQKVTGTKLDHHLELQALDKKRKETRKERRQKVSWQNCKKC